MKLQREREREKGRDANEAKARERRGLDLIIYFGSAINDASILKAMAFFNFISF